MSNPFNVVGINPCCVPSKSRADELAISQRMSVERRIVRTGSVDGMVKLDGGPFLMGTEDREGFPADGEGPVRETHLDPFYVDATHVQVEDRVNKHLLKLSNRQRCELLHYQQNHEKTFLLTSHQSSTPNAQPQDS